MPTVPTRKDRSTARVIRDILGMESLVKVVPLGVIMKSMISIQPIINHISVPFYLDISECHVRLWPVITEIILTIAMTTPTARTPKGRSTARVIRDTLEMVLFVQVNDVFHV